MPPAADPYAVLGIAANATPDAIQKAYRKLGAVAGAEIGAPETGAVAGPEIGAAGSAAPGTGVEATGVGGRAGSEAEASGAGARAGTGGPQLAGAAPVAVETIGGTAGTDPGSKNGPVNETGCVGC